MPRDTNVHGTIFDGIILSYIDQAGAIEARKHTKMSVLTVAMKEVEFKLPVFVGDIVSFYTRTARLGRTSVTVEVDVWADRYAELAERPEVPTHKSIILFGRRRRSGTTPVFQQ